MGGMPRLIKPMMASLRHGLPHDDDRYGWEFKWDGVRAIAYVTGGQIRLLSRTGKDMTGSYPELAVLPVPYTARRERLEELGLDADPVRTPPWYPGGAADILAASLAKALEGVV